MPYQKAEIIKKTRPSRNTICFGRGCYTKDPVNNISPRKSYRDHNFDKFSFVLKSKVFSRQSKHNGFRSVGNIHGVNIPKVKQIV